MLIIVRGKFNVQNTLNSFKHVGYTLSYIEESDTQTKIQNYNMALRIIKQTFKTSEVPRHTRMKAYMFWKYQYLVMAAKLEPSTMVT